MEEEHIGCCVYVQIGKWKEKGYEEHLAVEQGSDISSEM